MLSREVLFKVHVLLTPVSSLEGVGQITLARLRSEGLYTIRDLLLLKPSRIEHIPLQPVKQSLGALCAIQIQIQNIVRKPKSLIVICIDSAGDKLNVISTRVNVWFKNLPIGSRWILEGTLNNAEVPSMIHPEWHKHTESWNEYRPIYRSIRNTPQSKLRKFVLQVVKLARGIPEPVIQALCDLHECQAPKKLSEYIRIIGASEVRARQEQMRNISIGEAIVIASPMDVTIPQEKPTDKRA